jgi:hypothetical protein
MFPVYGKWGTAVMAYERSHLSKAQYGEVGSILDSPSKQRIHNRNLEITTPNLPIKVEVIGRQGQVHVCG